jgi:WD40 repeat protein
MATLGGHTDPIGSIALNSDGTRTLSGGRSEFTTRLWDVGGATVIRSASSNSNGAAFSPDGTLVAYGHFSDTELTGSVIIWDAETGADVTALCCHEGNVFAVAFGPDAVTLASTEFRDGSLRYWDVTSGEELWSRTDPSGRFSAVDLKVWDSATGVEILAFEGHAGLIAAIDFSPDGSQLISGGLDALAKIWDVATGVEVQTLTKHPRAVTGVAWGSDGIIATVSDLGDVRLHIRDLDALERIARQRVTRSLTEAECRQYLHVEGCPTP